MPHCDTPDATPCSVASVGRQPCRRWQRKCYCGPVCRDVCWSAPCFRLSVKACTRIWILGAAALALLGLGWFFLQGPAASNLTPTAAAHAEPSEATVARASKLDDPLFPERPAVIDPKRAGTSDSVSSRPAKAFQYSLDSDERGGVEPCNTPAPREAIENQLVLGSGRLALPPAALNADGRFDLVIHLHGNEPVVREHAASGQRFALYTETLHGDRSYASVFSGSALFSALVDQIAARVSQRTGRSASVRHVAVSAWSAGFEGVRALLHQLEDPRLDAVVLVDGLHAPRDPQALAARMAPFEGFARLAMSSRKFMLITHSSIPTPDYASTTETAHYLIHQLGGRPMPVQREDGFGLSLVDYYTSGQLHVRGYAGNDKADHCAQLFLLRTAFAALGRRWRG